MMFYWLVVPTFAVLLARWWWRRAETPRQRTVVAVVCGAGFLWLAWVLFGGEKMFLDYKVKRLCAKDGGVKVYETVKLPPEKFNQWGQVNFYRPDQGENALGSDYVFKQETHLYRKGKDYSFEATMGRWYYAVIRRSDKKVLAETVIYGRGGGDLPGPWHPSSFSCPENNQAGPNALLYAVFVNSIVKTGE
jgi:hypothetical protein